MPSIFGRDSEIPFLWQAAEKNHSSFDKAQDERASTKFCTQEIPFVVRLSNHERFYHTCGFLSLNPKSTIANL